MEAPRLQPEDDCYDKLARMMQESGITRCIVNADTTILELEGAPVRGYATERLRTLAHDKNMKLAFLTSHALDVPSSLKPRRPIRANDHASVGQAVRMARLFLDEAAPANNFVYVSGEADATNILRHARSIRVSEQMAHFCLTSEMLQNEYERRGENLRSMLGKQLASEDSLWVGDAPQESGTIELAIDSDLNGMIRTT